LEPSPTPWRVLEDPVDATVAPAPASGGPRPVPTGIGAVSRSTLLAVGGAILLALAAFGLAFGSGSSGTVAVVGATPVDSQRAGSISGSPVATTGADGERVVVVEIVGAVSHPGVFRMAHDARVGDLLTAAGGYGPRVDAARAGRELNLAAPLHDGDQVRVPSRDDSPAASDAPGAGTGSPAGGSSGSAGPIDINHASASELDTLPGIGPATAAKIIASRDGQPFTAVDDLRTRKLVGEKTFDGLKDLVTVR
jgi:competence protein ComEA